MERECQQNDSLADGCSCRKTSTQSRSYSTSPKTSPLETIIEVSTQQPPSSASRTMRTRSSTRAVPVTHRFAKLWTGVSWDRSARRIVVLHLRGREPDTM